MINLKFCLGLAERKTSLGAIGRISPGFDAISNQNYVQKSPTVSISMISILTRLNHQVFRISDLSRLPDINVEGRAVEEKEQRLSISCEFDILGWTRSFAIVKMIYLMFKSVCSFFIFLIIPHQGHCVAGRSSVAIYSLKRDQVPLNF